MNIFYLDITHLLQTMILQPPIFLSNNTQAKAVDVSIYTNNY
ncbi:hypothetical protein NOS3756_47950 [Nostoc sp. NIES-3756]|nr:hypothetical protein NOS3756_47950 [Nostoc sp. NIES-3756]